MPARPPRRLLLPLLLALAGCSNGVSAPVTPAAQTPVAIAESAAPAPSSAPTAAGPVLTGIAAFEGRVPSTIDVQAFVLGRPGQVVAAGGANVVAPGGANVIAPGGGNVIAPGGANVIAPGGGNYRLAAVEGAEGTFALELPASVAPGTLLKLVVTGGGQTLVAVVQAPEARHVAQSAGDAATVSMATTLAYLMISKRLEGAGQATHTDKGEVIQSLVTVITGVYAAMTDSARAALADATEGDRRAALTTAMAAAFQGASAPGTEALSATGVDAMLAIAPTVGSAFSDAVAKLNTGIRSAVSAGAPKPDTAFLGPISFGRSVSLGSVYTGSGHAPAPAHSETGVAVQDGGVTNPTGGPTIVSQP